jgi:mediator of replication checkpoint protein 1
MLADIDNAPTPSPTRKNLIVDDRPTVSRPFMDDSEDEAEPAASKAPHGSNETTRTSAQSSGEDDDEEEGIIRRPQGRAARRMLDLGAPNTASQNDSDDDLYSATSLKPTSERRRREAFERAASGSPSASSHKKGTGLFVSPAKSTLNKSDGEDDLPGPNRLAELVAQKRAERLARESEQQKVKKSRKSNGNNGSEHASSDLPEEAFEGSQEAPADPNVERILSDAARPTRKASKKAMLEMERETQRLARQQALAHQIKVKKKFSTTDLFARFNFRQPNQQSNQNEKNSSSMPSSDGIEASPSAARPKEPFSTPPSSPPTPLDKQRLLVERGALTKMTSIPEDTLAKMNLLREDTLTSFVADEEEEELPEMEGIIMSSLPQEENAKSAAQVSTQEPDSKIARWSKKSAPQTYRDEGSDDDLEVLEPLPKHLQVFDRIKPSKRQEAHSNAIHTLRHLSHLGQVDAKPNRPTNAKPSIHPQVLEAQLRKKAREQAFAAQQERIAELKAKGITIQTTEEKEKEAEEFENLLEKARLDAQDLRKAEKAARREANGEGTVEVSDDETEDEDYYDRSDAEDEEEVADAGKNDLIDDNADESETNEDAEDVAAEEDDDLVESEAEVEAAGDPSAEAQDNNDVPTITRKSRKSHVIEDDDDDDVDEDHDGLEIDGQASSDVIPGTANVADEDEDPFAAFGFGAAKSDDNAMSATQAFNATMQAPSQDTQEDSYDILKHIPPPSSFVEPPTIPVMASQDLDDSQTQLAAGPSLGESQDIELNWETQPPETPGRGLIRKESDLSETPGWEPTQDPGLPSPWTGGRRGQLERAPTLTSAPENDHETQSTVQLRISESPAPDVVSKRGRLQQRKKLSPDDSEDEAEPEIPAQKKDAFKEMKRQRLGTTCNCLVAKNNACVLHEH